MTSVMESIKADVKAGFLGDYCVLGNVEDGTLRLEHLVTGEKFSIPDPRGQNIPYYHDDDLVKQDLESYLKHSDYQAVDVDDLFICSVCCRQIKVNNYSWHINCEGDIVCEDCNEGHAYD